MTGKLRINLERPAIALVRSDLELGQMAVSLLAASGLPSESDCACAQAPSPGQLLRESDERLKAPPLPIAPDALFARTELSIPQRAESLPALVCAHTAAQAELCTFRI